MEMQVHSHVYNYHTLDPTLSLLNLFHTLFFLKINFNIIHLSMPNSPKWSLQYWFMTKILYVCLI
jgi:hypothetical protein